MNPDPSNRRLSLRDLAKHLGVSHATVSLALRNSPRISPAVREKVNRAAADLGYKPDPMLSALSHYRRDKSAHPITASIAWINAWEDPARLRSFREFDLYWQGATSAAGKYGYRIEEFRLGKECSPERLHQILRARGIRGILLPPLFPHPDWREFPWADYAVVRYGRSLKVPQSHVVTADQVANTILAFEEIRKRGYERIGFVDNDMTTVRRGHLFQAGFLLAQHSLEEKLRIPVLNLSGASAGDRSKLVHRWLKRHRIEAVLTCVADFTQLLEKGGIRVPDDISVAGTTILDMPISAGIDQHSHEIGRVGFLMLNSLINDGAFGIPRIFRQILVEGSWVDGDTLPCPAPTPVKRAR